MGHRPCGAGLPGRHAQRHEGDDGLSRTEDTRPLVVPQPVNTDPEDLRWGIVSTVKAPLAQIARFAAFHLDLGVHRMVIHLDVPDASIADRLAHPRLHFVQCDDTYWAGRGDALTSTHQRRQMFNATRVYKHTKLDWLAHIDVDEFLLPPGPIRPLLAAVDPNTPLIELPPVEMMTGGKEPHNFKRFADLDARCAIYPTFGEFARGGFISTSAPKVFARTGLPDIRLGIHALRHHGDKVETGIRLPGFELGHAHAPDFETFAKHLAYRLEKGSYHDREGKMNRVGLLIRTLCEEPDPQALRNFHDELCTPTPERLELLAAHGALRSETLDLDAKVSKYFGALDTA